jgi:hypothetical protein
MGHFDQYGRYFAALAEQVDNEIRGLATDMLFDRAADGLTKGDVDEWHGDAPRGLMWSDFKGQD